jgi:hypothetical protein
VFEDPTLNFARNRADDDDILGDAYEFLMRHFATDSGKSKGLVVDAMLTHATGTAEREAAPAMLARMAGRHRITLNADKAYDIAGFIAALRAIRVTPHVAQNTNRRRTAIDSRTTRHAGYKVSIRIRKKIEEIFGWAKTSGGLRKTRHCGGARVVWNFTADRGCL